MMYLINCIKKNDKYFQIFLCKFLIDQFQYKRGDSMNVSV